MNLVIDHNIARFNSTLGAYAKAAALPPEAVLPRAAGKLGFQMFKNLRKLMPQKEKTRRERLAALKAGGGVYVRPTIRKQVMEKFRGFTDSGGKQKFFRNKKSQTEVSTVIRRGKNLNLQALMVQRELSARESGRGYLSIRGRLPGVQKIQGHIAFFGRYKQKLAEAGLRIVPDGGQLTVELGNSKVGLARGLRRPRGIQAIAASIEEVREDMLVYIRRKQGEAAEKAGIKG